MRMDMEQILKKFCEDYGFEYFEKLKIETMDDISAYVRDDDYKYYLDRKKQIDCANGLFYVNAKGQLMILIKNQDEVNMLSTLIHEYVHVCDYKKLSDKYVNTDFRELQEDNIFIYWTEFHATYISYSYLINLCLQYFEKNIDNIKDEIINKLREFYLSDPKLDKQETIDKSIRTYGSYIALYDEFSEKLELYPEKFFLNEEFLNIYTFLSTHKTFDDFIMRYNKFEDMLYKI